MLPETLEIVMQHMGGVGTPGTMLKLTPFTEGKPPTAPRPSAPGARRLSFETCAG